MKEHISVQQRKPRSDTRTTQWDSQKSKISSLLKDGAKGMTTGAIVALAGQGVSGLGNNPAQVESLFIAGPPIYANLMNGVGGGSGLTKDIPYWTGYTIGACIAYAHRMA